MSSPLTFKQYLTITSTLSEAQINEVNWRALAAGGALAAGLAAGGQAQAQDQQLSPVNGTNTTTASFAVSGQNSPEYNLKMYPVYRELLNDFMSKHPTMDQSLARDVVNTRWRAEYRTNPPRNVTRAVASVTPN